MQESYAPQSSGDKARPIPSLLRLGPLACILLVAGSAWGKDAGPGKLYLVVTRDVFRQAAQPLIDRRRAEGFEVVVSVKPPDEAIRALAPRRPDMLLLVGDDQYFAIGRTIEFAAEQYAINGLPAQPRVGERYVEIEGSIDPAACEWLVPAKWEKRYRWTQRHGRMFASDAAWGDLDGDRRPDIPVGRLPVRTPAELTSIVDKILRYESRPPSLDDLRLPVFAGDPMNDVQRDGALWTALGTMSTGVLLGSTKAEAPLWAEPWLLSASNGQAFQGCPQDYADLVAEQMRRGGFLVMLIGHGSQEAFYFGESQGKDVRYTAETAAGQFASGPPSPPLVLSSCFCGDFTGTEDCIGESLLRMPAGPAAVMAATTVSEAGVNYLVDRSMVQLARLGSFDRIGDFNLAAQRHMPVSRSPLIERILMNADPGEVGEEPDLDKLRLDNQLLSVLLGDPAMHMRLPRRMGAVVARDAAGWRWQVQRPAGAVRLHVSFRPHRQQRLTVPPNADTEQRRVLLRDANDTFAFQELPAPPADGPWQGSIDRPGTLRLVAFTGDALYVAAVELKGD